MSVSQEVRLLPYEKQYGFPSCPTKAAFSTHLLNWSNDQATSTYCIHIYKTRIGSTKSPKLPNHNLHKPFHHSQSCFLQTFPPITTCEKVICRFGDYQYQLKKSGQHEVTFLFKHLRNSARYITFNGTFNNKAWFPYDLFWNKPISGDL